MASSARSAQGGGAGWESRDSAAFFFSAALQDRGQAVGRRLLRPRVDLSP